jgi:hypothetical protein
MVAARLGVIAAAAPLVVGCGSPKIEQSTMTEGERTELKAALAKLDAVLREKADFISSKLAPPAGDKVINDLRQGLGGSQVECLELWYRWHNGSDRLIDILPLGRMLSVQEALHDREMEREIPFVDSKRLAAIKILEDGSGDGFFLDISSTRPRVFYHMLEDPFPRDFGRLEKFVEFIAQVHNSGLSSRNDNGMVRFDLDKYHELERKYRSSLGVE